MIFFENKIRLRNETIAQYSIQTIQNKGHRRLETPLDYLKLNRIADLSFFINKKAKNKFGFDNWLIQIKKSYKPTNASIQPKIRRLYILPISYSRQSLI